MPAFQSLTGASCGLLFSVWVLLELGDMQCTSTESGYVPYTEIVDAEIHYFGCNSTMNHKTASLFPCSLLPLLYKVMVLKVVC